MFVPIHSLVVANHVQGCYTTTNNRSVSIAKI